MMPSDDYNIVTLVFENLSLFSLVKFFWSSVLFPLLKQNVNGFISHDFPYSQETYENIKLSELNQVKLKLKYLSNVV